jgi:hypothetical protein
MAEDGMFNMLKGIKEKSVDQETRMRNLEVRVLQRFADQKQVPIYHRCICR